MNIDHILEDLVSIVEAAGDKAVKGHLRPLWHLIQQNPLPSEVSARSKYLAFRLDYSGTYPTTTSKPSEHHPPQGY